MNVFESITSAFSSVFANKMRSVLTMLGIIIGIGAVIMITSIGDGFKKQTQEQLSSMGAESIQVSVKYSPSNKNSDYLTLDDKDLLALPENVTCVVPVYQEMGTVTRRDPSKTSDIYLGGTSEDYRQVQSVTMLYGRFLMESDIANKSGVIIIDNKLATQVFGREDVVGEKLSISTRYGVKQFDIVGISENTNSSPLFETPAIGFAPISTLMDCFATERVDSYYLLVKDQNKANQTIEEVNMLLETKHNNKDRYSMQNFRDMLGQVDSILNNITMFIALVAGISLVVGGIGIMNIMLVTVTERTREIGIRKSLGATNGNILFQFLVEAMILTIIGGIIGILLGYGGSYLVSLMVPIEPAMSPVIIAGTVIISGLIGIFFGVYPANKAAELDPIEALRYE